MVEQARFLTSDIGKMACFALCVDDSLEQIDEKRLIEYNHNKDLMQGFKA